MRVYIAARHIYNTAGLAGLYAGAPARAMSVGLTSFTRQATKALLGPVVGPSEKAEEKESLGVFAHKIAFDVACGCFAILVSHPFSGGCQRALPITGAPLSDSSDDLTVPQSQQTQQLYARRLLYMPGLY